MASLYNSFVETLDGNFLAAADAGSVRVLSAWDYVVLAAFLLGSLAVGVVVSLVGKRDESGNKMETDTEEFLMGSRKMQYLPVALSLLVSFNSAILILGGPLDTYNNGTMYIYSVLAENIAVVLAAFVFVPVFYKLCLTSSFEYLEMRYSSPLVRIMGDILLILNNIVYMGLALYSPSTAMSYVTNGALSTEVSIIISGAVCMLYTAWGGIKAVIWTDVFQSIVMTAGVVAIIIKGLIDVGGFGRMWELGVKYNRVELDNFQFNPLVRHTFWGLVLGNGIGYTGTFGVTQAAVQRYCSVPTLRKAQLSVILACLGAAFFVGSTVLAGLVIFGYYADKACDPIGGGLITDGNQIVPYFVMEVLNYPPVPGIFVASLFAGAMSSVSSSLSALSAITWQDLLKPFCFRGVSETKATWINRISVVAYGIVSILMGFVVSNLGGTVLQASLGFTGAIGAPLTGLFALGILVPFSNKFGALFGSVMGLGISGWLSVGAYFHGKQLVSRPTNITMCPTQPPPTITMLPTSSATTTVETPHPLDGWYSISYEWWSLIGIVGTLVPGMIASLVTGGWKQEVNESLINPYFARFYKFVGRYCGCCGTNMVHPVEGTDDDNGNQAVELSERKKEPTSDDTFSGASQQSASRIGPQTVAAGAESTADELAGAESTADEPAGAEAAADEPAGAEAAADEPAGAEAAADEPAGAESTADEPAGAEAEADEPAGAEAEADEPAGAEAAADEPAGAEAAADEPAGAEAEADGPAGAESTENEPVGAEAAADESIERTTSAEAAENERRVQGGSAAEPAA